jgi:hypothetical protein
MTMSKESKKNPTAATAMKNVSARFSVTLSIARLISSGVSL